MLIACIGMFAQQAYPLQVWGIVYLCSGLTTTFVQIDKRSHTFFLERTVAGGIGAATEYKS